MQKSHVSVPAGTFARVERPLGERGSDLVVIARANGNDGVAGVIKVRGLRMRDRETDARLVDDAEQRELVDIAPVGARFNQFKQCNDAPVAVGGRRGQYIGDELRGQFAIAEK